MRVTIATTKTIPTQREIRCCNMLRAYYVDVDRNLGVLSCRSGAKLVLRFFGVVYLQVWGGDIDSFIGVY